MTFESEQRHVCRDQQFEEQSTRTTRVLIPSRENLYGYLTT
jgi:hypothetical protein